MQKLKDCVLYAPAGLNRVASHAMAGNEDAIERQRAVGTQ